MPTLSNVRRRGRVMLVMLLCSVLALSGAGCASLQLATLAAFAAEKPKAADAAHPAIEVLAIWQAAEGPGPGGIPTRGFAGQIFFFTQDNPLPVTVEGKARIYVFDDHGSVHDQSKPLRQFDFDPQSWKAHLQSSKLGPTYGVFIPYPRADFHQAVCSLRVRFNPTNAGIPLYSSSSTIVLPGPPIKETETVQDSPLNGLVKKLQQSEGARRAWANTTVNTDARPLSGNPGAATPLPTITQTFGGTTAATDPALLLQQSQPVNPLTQADPEAAAGFQNSQPNAGALNSAVRPTFGNVNPVGPPAGIPSAPVQEPSSGRIKLEKALGAWSPPTDGAEAIATTDPTRGELMPASAVRVEPASTESAESGSIGSNRAHPLAD